MKKLIFLLIMVVSFGVYAEGIQPEGSSDNKQIRVESVTMKNGEEKKLIKTIGYYPDMEIEYICERIDGEDEERWTWYFKNGTIMLTGVRSSMGNIGEWKKYYSNGKIAEKIYFNDLGERMENLYEGYYPNGELAVKRTPTLMEKYNSNGGNLDSTMEYKFLPNGDSVPDGEYREYEQGKLVLKGRYTDGKEDGTWTWYDKSGKVEYTAIFKNGVLKSPEKINE